jgi:hypothetical protein
MKRIALLIVAFVGLTYVSSAQGIQLDGMLIQSESFEYEFSINRERPKTSSISFDAKNRRYFFKFDSTMLEIDIRRGKFKKHHLSTDVEMGRQYFDTLSNRILMWDYGVGRVFWWNPANNTLERIDNSFPHKNQFNHAQWVNPKNYDIYAFGGYGLFTNKSFTSVFQPIHKEWYLVHESVLNKKPLQPFSINEIGNDLLFIQSTNVFVHKNGALDTLHDARYVNWILNTSNFEWTALSQLSLNDFSNYDLEKLTLIEENKLRLQSIGQTTLLPHPTDSTEKPLAISFIYDEASNLKLVLTHTGTGKAALITLGPLRPFPTKLIHPVYHKQDQAVYMLGFSELSSTGMNPILVFKSTHLDIPYLYDFVEENDISKPVEKPIVQSSSSPIWALSTGFLFLGFIIGFLIQRKKEIQKEELPVLENLAHQSDSSFVLKLIHQKKIELVVNQNVIHPPFSNFEIDILRLFVHAKLNGKQFIVTDDLNALFEYGNSSLDYARKQRNLTVKALEDRFQKIRPSKKPYILQKRNHEDSRKRDYSLNWELISLDNQF